MALLSIRDLVKAYPSEGEGLVEVVNVAAFELQPGEQVLLQGESGSGKSTLLNLIAGIVVADSGEILLSGENVSSLSESARDAHRARSLGYVFQNFNLLNAYTCLENVELGMSFGAGADREFALQLLARVGLANRQSYRPDQLSQGQKQRVAIARALANRPKLVLADEPTGNLDPSNAAIALELIQSLCRENGAALLFVSHDPQLVSKFERVINLAELNQAACLSSGGGGAE
jgi:ABC-type lipoprotein export system ATPase subunit